MTIQEDHLKNQINKIKSRGRKDNIKTQIQKDDYKIKRIKKNKNKSTDTSENRITPRKYCQ